MVYIVMDLCLFSIAKMPAAFDDFLHATSSSPDQSTSATLGPMVLGALVQDLLSAISHFHRLNLVHGNLKVITPTVLLCFRPVGRGLTDFFFFISEQCSQAIC